jgi:Met-zincin/Domain of unknown function (DUF5117)
MKRFELWTGLWVVTLSVMLGWASIVLPEDVPAGEGGSETPEAVEGGGNDASSGEADVTAEGEATDDAEAEVSEEEAFDLAIEDAEKLDGLITLYYNKEQSTILAEIDPDQLDRLYLLVATLSRGIGELGLVNGMPMGDFTFTLQKRGETIHLVLPNVNFRYDQSGDRGINQAILDRSFSDSTLYSFPIIATHPDRDSYLVDLTDLLVTSDISGFNSWIEFLGYTLNTTASYLQDVRAYPKNLEFESIVGFSGEPWIWLETIPDYRHFSLGFRYSLSELPENPDFRPREADNRVGYFLSAYQNLDETREPDRFVRLVQRWDLKKRDPEAQLSPPEQPIVFWIENTVPIEHRQAVRDGILSWNAAFEQAGFINAIEVRQMPDDADWDPEDVRYNTVRWLTTASTDFAGIGPSRVNPLTGEILDADILIDGDIARLASSQVAAYFGGEELGLERMAADLLTPRSSSQLPQAAVTSALPINLSQLQARCEGEQCQRLADIPAFVPRGWNQRSGLSSLCSVSNPQAALGVMALPLLQGTLPYRENFDEYVRQYITHVVSHEVGHTLGLRHNFHGSTHLSPSELNDPAIVAERGLIASVMDYTPVNIAPPGVPQGQFYATDIGAYDRWAIEYGYRDFSHQTPAAERQALNAIANRAQTNPEFAYGTDEDAWIGTDPDINVFDMSDDPVAFSQAQYDNARLMWDRLNSIYPNASGAAEELRQRFDLILMYYFRQTSILLDRIGGQSFTRTDPATGDRRVPLAPISRDQQLQSLDLVMDYIFAPDAFEFDADLLNRLVPPRWSHWGMSWSSQIDYPAFDRIALIQYATLASLMSPDRMEELREIEFKSAPGTALTLPDLFDRLDQAIWNEIQAAIPNNVTGLRRELQRNYVKLQVDMLLERTYAPEDARTLARRSLKRTRDRLETALNRSSQLDTYTQAHLEDTKIQIDQTLNAVRLTDQPEFNPFSLFGF